MVFAGSLLTDVFCFSCIYKLPGNGITALSFYCDTVIYFTFTGILQKGLFYLIKLLIKSLKGNYIFV
jgi:hypothetical protein